MKKIDKSSWPVLIVSNQISAENAEGNWLREIINYLTTDQGCSVVLSNSINDAMEIVATREDLGTIVFDWKNFERTEPSTKMKLLIAGLKTEDLPAQFLELIRLRNRYIPVLLMTVRATIEEFPDDVLAKVNGLIWKLSDTADFLSGRIERHVINYSQNVLPPFFSTLVKYVNEYKYAWHTPGHMGGEGFLKSPSGTAFHKFFGEDVLRADLSISVPELGSLLDHSGVTGDAETYSAKIFGADQTYYVLNGTSTANQIIWRSRILPGEYTLVDRNCHKSLNYAMVITDADPQYMRPLRNKLGIIGPVDLKKFKDVKDKDKIKMTALTNSTYDGVCYDVNLVKESLNNYFKKIEAMHFDEAWYAYAKFHPVYKNHFGMELPKDNKTVFCSQSTHKLLTAFSQASMIHVKLSDFFKTDAEKKRFHDLFNESYMMHGSTSPQYNMVASLEVATKMMHDNGEQALNDTIEEAIELRKKVVSTKSSYERNNEIDKSKRWFFGMWQPLSIKNIETRVLAREQKYWIIKEKDNWHGFDVKGDYTMLDPVKLTFTCPGINIRGKFSRTGIPAAIVTNYLINKGIVCEKSDYYSWLMLNSLGTTKGKQGTLVAELLKFKELYDDDEPLENVFPKLVADYPEKYKGQTLKQHCQAMHEAIQNKGDSLLNQMDEAFKNLPERDETPAEAYKEVVAGNVKRVKLKDLGEEEKPVAAVMLVPYPPGIPIAMGGEELLYKSKIVQYLLSRQDFEFNFPGYESDIHGIERSEPDEKGKKYFETFILNNNG